MACREHEALATDVVDDLHLAGVHHLRVLHRVREAGVGHLEDDLVPLLEFVDVMEGGEVGGPVAGYRNRPSLAGERCLRVVAGPLLQ